MEKSHFALIFVWNGWSQVFGTYQAPVISHDTSVENPIYYKNNEHQIWQFFSYMQWSLHCLAPVRYDFKLIYITVYLVY